MKKLLDKLGFKIDKKIYIFLIIITMTALITGALCVSLLNKNDKSTLIEYFGTFKNNYINIDYLKSFKELIINNYSMIALIWLLGISIIGLPVMIILYFSKVFTIGFSIGTIIYNCKLKGILISLGYITPHLIINTLILILLLVYAISFSIKLFESIIKKKSIDFNIIMNKYIKVLVFVLIVNLLMVLFETFITPIIINAILNVI